MALERTLMLIADIGGYTRFMTLHRINLAHSQDVVAQLLEAVIDAAHPTFRLAKLEGDAAFLYAPCPKDLDGEAFARAVLAIRRAFVARRDLLTIDRLCSCEGCTQATDLKLKFVAHVGDVWFQKVKRLTELAGVDVILVHRLLKNGVPVPEYLLATEPIAVRLPAELTAGLQSIEEDLEGLGTTPLCYVDLDRVASDALPPPPPSRWRALWGWITMTWRSLPYMLGLKQPCDGFRNFPK